MRRLTNDWHHGTWMVMSGWDLKRFRLVQTFNETRAPATVQPPHQQWLKQAINVTRAIMWHMQQCPCTYNASQLENETGWTSIKTPNARPPRSTWSSLISEIHRWWHYCLTSSASISGSPSLPGEPLQASATTTTPPLHWNCCFIFVIECFSEPEKVWQKVCQKWVKSVKKVDRKCNRLKQKTLNQSLHSKQTICILNGVGAFRYEPLTNSLRSCSTRSATLCRGPFLSRHDRRVFPEWMNQQPGRCSKKTLSLK